MQLAQIFELALVQVSAEDAVAAPMTSSAGFEKGERQLVQVLECFVAGSRLREAVANYFVDTGVLGRENLLHSVGAIHAPAGRNWIPEAG